MMKCRVLCVLFASLSKLNACMCLLRFRYVHWTRLGLPPLQVPASRSQKVMYHPSTCWNPVGVVWRDRLNLALDT